MAKRAPTSPSRLLEAIKLMNDWSKWLVTVQTASIAALGFLSRQADLEKLTTLWGKVAIFAGVSGIVFFTASIGVASYLLLYLPSIAEELPDQVDTATNLQPLCYTRVPFRPGWQVGTFTAWQSRFFVAGIVLFALTFIALAIDGTR